MKQERLGTNREIEREHSEKQQVENPNAAKAEARVHQHREEHAREDGEEDERVHIPGAAEKKRERRERLHLQERKGDAEKKHVPIKSAQGAARRDHQDARERDGRDREQALEVNGGEGFPRQINERPIIGRSGSIVIRARSLRQSRAALYSLGRARFSR